MKVLIINGSPRVNGNTKEEFDSDFGKDILKKLGISDEYEGIGHCALGYAAEPAKDPAPRKENYVYYI